MSEPIKKSDCEDELNTIINNKIVKQLFSTLPKTKTIRQNIQNINNHILNELGITIKRTQKQYRIDGKKIKETYLSLEQGTIIKGYLERIEKYKNEPQACLIL